MRRRGKKDEYGEQQGKSGGKARNKRLSKELRDGTQSGRGD